MVLIPGKSEGTSNNRHRGADQWLFVVSGNGSAHINGKRYGLRKGTLLLIERNDKHEIRNTGHVNLCTLNFYVPPAYTKDSEPMKRARPGGD